MSTVTINKGTNFGKEISGTFKLLDQWFPSELSDSDALLGDGKVFVDIDGKRRGVWVFKSDIQIEGASYVFKEELKETVEEMTARINTRFNVMGMMTKGVIGGNIRSLIISGAAGIGKTYNLNKELSAAAEAEEITYTMVNSKISPIMLYKKLYENRDENSVLLLDDVDVYSDMDTLNLLKAALDTGDIRRICWNTASSFLADNDIPNEFEYEGTCVFITNVDIDHELERGTKLSPHLGALVSRSIYLDLGVHSNEEIMVRVNEVVMNTNMLQSRGLKNSEVVEVLTWMQENVNSLRNVSLRTVCHIADFVMTDHKNWREIAKVTQLKN